MKKILHGSGMAWLYSYLLILLYGVGFLAKLIVIDGKVYSNRWMCGILLLIVFIGAIAATGLAGLVKKVWNKIENSHNYQTIQGGCNRTSPDLSGKEIGVLS